MIPDKQIFLDNICYTPLVFGRVNKKLATDFSNDEIQAMVNRIIQNSDTSFEKRGKNFYLRNQKTELVVNSFNYRLITANKIK